MALRKLTAAQERVFRFVANYFANHQRMPTLREIGTATGTPNPSGVLGHLKHIEKKGYMRSGEYGKTRSWEIVGLAPAVAPAVHAHVDAMIASSTTSPEAI